MSRPVAATTMLLALLLLSMSGHAPVAQQVRPMATCNPETNPDCGGGGGGCSPGPCSCYSGTVVSITTLCSVCGYDFFNRRFIYDGTWIVTRECCTDSCPCSTITCWQGQGCGWCQ